MMVRLRGLDAAERPLTSSPAAMGVVKDPATEVKSPMDLHTVQAQLETRYYQGPNEFLADVRRVFSRALDQGDESSRFMALISLAVFEGEWTRRCTLLGSTRSPPPHYANGSDGSVWKSTAPHDYGGVSEKDLTAVPVRCVPSVTDGHTLVGQRLQVETSTNDGKSRQPPLMCICTPADLKIEHTYISHEPRLSQSMKIW